MYWFEEIKNHIKNIDIRVTFNQDRVENLIVEKKVITRGPKIVAIGGGTGLSTMLRGLKQYTENITAVVTVADDGGSSGMLRQDLGMLPPGDIRNCILALADMEPAMEQLLQYRFTEGSLKGQNFGNLFIAAMNGISGNFVEAVKRFSDVLAVTGRVLPVTAENINLCAVFDNGTEVCGESKIAQRKIEQNCRIKNVFLSPKKVNPLPEVIEAIGDADMIILGPGSLYTSIIPNLLVDGVSEAIQNSSAIKIYVCNIMTQPGETEKYTAYDHLKAIQEHAGGQFFIDYCIVNTRVISGGLLEKYFKDGAEPVRIDRAKFRERNIKLIEEDVLKIYHDYIRHDTEKLAKILAKLSLNIPKLKDRKRIIDYYYVKSRLK